MHLHVFTVVTGVGVAVGFRGLGVPPEPSLQANETNTKTISKTENPILIFRFLAIVFISKLPSVLTQAKKTRLEVNLQSAIINWKL